MWKKEKRDETEEFWLTRFLNIQHSVHYIMKKISTELQARFFIFVFFWKPWYNVITVLALQHKKKCFILFASLGSHMRSCQLQVCSVYLKKKGRKKLNIPFRYVNQKQCTGWNSKFRRILLMSVETESFCEPIFFITLKKDDIYVKAQPHLAITPESNCAVRRGSVNDSITYFSLWALFLAEKYFF